MCERLATDSLIPIIQAVNPSKVLPDGGDMNNVELSIDKIAVEYHGVTVNSIINWYFPILPKPEIPERR